MTDNLSNLQLGLVGSTPIVWNPAGQVLPTGRNRLVLLSANYTQQEPIPNFLIRPTQQDGQTHAYPHTFTSGQTVIFFGFEADLIVGAGGGTYAD
jgi:hypothetical protein